ncbi:MAG: hypothetical protein WDM91_10860 [Rhizomicrobium sp.]
MLDSIDAYLVRRRRKNYDCRDLSAEVWRALTGEELLDRDIKTMQRLDAPVDPCIVLFRRRGENHMGVFVRGKVLHLAEMSARFERLDIAGLGFVEARFYR